MQHDEVIWEVIRHNHCSFMSKIETGNFCRNPYNVTGICNRSSCPLANSRYATIRDHDGVFFLYMKTIERAHMPNKLWERVKLPRNYAKAIEIIDKHLMYWPKLLIHKVKQRLTKMTYMRLRMKKLALKTREKVMTLPRKEIKRESRREKKAEKAAVLDKNIEKELLERLKKGVYPTEIYNYPSSVYNEVLDMEEVPEEEVEEEAEVEYVEGDYELEEEEDMEDFAGITMDEPQIDSGEEDEESISASKRRKGLDKDEPNAKTKKKARVLVEMYWPKLLIHKVKQRLTKMTYMRLRMKKLALKTREKVMTLPRKEIKRESRREKKAEKAAVLDKNIEKELLERLKKGVYPTEIYNYPSSVYNEVLDMEEVPEEEVEEEAEVEYVEGDYELEEEEDMEDFAGITMDEPQIDSGEEDEESISASKRRKGLDKDEPNAKTKKKARVLVEMYWPKLLIHKVKQRLTKMTYMRLRMKKLALKTREKVMTLPRKEIKRESRREKKAEKAAVLDKNIEKELLERLKKGVYPTEIYNYPSSVYNEVLDMEEVPEEEVEEEAEVEYVEGDYELEEEEDMEDFAGITMDEPQIDSGEEDEESISASKRRKGLDKDEPNAKTKKKARVLVEIEHDGPGRHKIVH